MPTTNPVAKLSFNFTWLLTLLLASTACIADDLTARLKEFQGLQLPAPQPQKAWKSSALLKISPSLLEFNDAITKGNLFNTDLNETAKSLGISYEDDRVAVALTARNSLELETLRRAVREIGGETTITFENTVFALIPGRTIPGLEQVAELDYAQPQFLRQPTAISRSPGEGGRSTGIERLHAAGITGKGVKIGIIDWGYQNYQKLADSGVLPQPKATRAFNRKHSMDSGGIHGTACAEIIHSMAPDAEIYLTTIDGQSDQIIQAAEWLIQQGVNIISFSGGGHFGPMNGTDILSRYIDQAVQKSENKLLWVNAAGNEGEDHWLGLTVDNDHDNLIDIPIPEIPDNGIMIVNGDQYPIRIVINWDDWGPNPEQPSARIDLDAELYRVDKNNKLTKVASSTNPQRGRGEPQEIISLQKPEKGKDYALVLLPRNMDRPVRLHVSISGGLLMPTKAEGSIGSPATAKLALAVGAVDVSKRQLEGYSSQGPTDDGRLKPEITAPDNTLSLSYQSVGHDRFPGTSAACPHVSGYSALLKQMQPDISRDELIKRIIAYATPMGEGRPNNQYGYGHISATNIDLAGNAPPSTTGGSASSGRGNGRVFQPILDIMKQSGQ